MESLAPAFGQAGGKRLLGIAVKQPEHGKTERQVEYKHAGQCVAEAAMVSKWNEVLEIGGKAADDHGGHDETRAPEWQSCGRVGEGEGHYENYDGCSGPA